MTDMTRSRLISAVGLVIMLLGSAMADLHWPATRARYGSMVLIVGCIVAMIGVGRYVKAARARRAAGAVKD